MIQSKTSFQSFLEEEVNRIKGIYYPVKTGYLKTLLIRKAACRKLHPNPHDEFCFPEIGPNQEIISKYERDYRRFGSNPSDTAFASSDISEPLLVEKVRPDGYMILNGHHRWAGAMRAGITKLPIRIVNLTQEKDVRKMLKAGRAKKRVSLDLDEVVFCSADDSLAEKALPFPLNRLYPERIRRGIPAVFNELSLQGYDVWVYSAGYYSFNTLKRFFRHCHAPVTGIVTGTARKGPSGSATMKELEKLFSTRYHSTLHIDSHTILSTSGESRGFEEYSLSGSPETWSREVIDYLDRQRSESLKKA